MRRGEARPRARSAVPFAVEADRGVGGNVAQIGNGAVGVSPLVGGLAATVRLDVLPGVAVRVLGPTGLARVVRHVAVRHLPVGGDPLSAVDAREPHAADVGRLDIETYAETHEEDSRR